MKPFNRKRPNLPPGYEIRLGGTGAYFFEVYDPDGRYIDNVPRFLIYTNPIKQARRVAWAHHDGRWKGAVVERGE